MRVIGRSSLVVGKSPTRSKSESIHQTLSFRAKKLVRSRTSFTVEEPAVRPRHRVSGVISLAAILAMTLLAGSFKSIAQNVPGSIGEAKKQLAFITDSLANRAVSSIEILHMPDQMETRASVTPENLGKWFDFKVTVNKVNEWSGQDNLIKVLRTTTLTEGSLMGDMRFRNYLQWF
jgi:hypothetical protein